MVTENTEIISRITVSGTVNLILCDGVTLMAAQGITVAAGNTLNIYGQNGGTGKLIVTGTENAAGIGGGAGDAGGTITIYGGKVTAAGHDLYLRTINKQPTKPRKEKESMRSSFWIRRKRPSGSPGKGTMTE